MSRVVEHSIGSVHNSSVCAHYDMFRTRRGHRHVPYHQGHEYALDKILIGSLL